MNQTVITNAGIQKGYDGAPFLHFFGEDDKNVSFSLSESFYDPKAEKKKGWNNWQVKAFGALCERIQKMGLKEGSRVNVSGSLRTEKWTDKETGEKRSRICLILSNIEYSYSGEKKAQESDAPVEEEAAVQPQRAL